MPYIIHAYKIRPVKVIHLKSIFGGMFNQYTLKCLDGAEELISEGSSNLYETEKDAIPKLLEQLNEIINTYEEKIKDWKNRKEYYERKLK